MFFKRSSFTKVEEDFYFSKKKSRKRIEVIALKRHSFKKIWNSLEISLSAIYFVEDFFKLKRYNI